MDEDDAGEAAALVGSSTCRDVEASSQCHCASQTPAKSSGNSSSGAPSIAVRWYQGIILLLVVVNLLLVRQLNTPLPPCVCPRPPPPPPAVGKPVETGSLVKTSDQWVGLLHRNCYKEAEDAADPFFDFYAQFHFRWHNAWWGATDAFPPVTSGHPIVLNVVDVKDISSHRFLLGERGRLTLFFVAGMLQPGEVHNEDDVDDDTMPETFTESLRLLNSILLLCSMKLELVIATDDWGVELYTDLFSQLTRTKKPVEVSLIRVSEEWTSRLAAEINYSLTAHHSGIWGTLKVR